MRKGFIKQNKTLGRIPLLKTTKTGISIRSRYKSKYTGTLNANGIGIKRKMGSRKYVGIEGRGLGSIKGYYEKNNRRISMPIGYCLKILRRNKERYT